MDDNIKNEIIYDENWHSISEQERIVKPAEITDDNSFEPNKPLQKHKPVSLIAIQLIICLIIAFIVFLLKSMNSDTYRLFCDWYNTMMSDTLISNKTFEDIDLSEYFDYFDSNSYHSTPDEV